MPTLEFKGKPFVYSHHLSVPFRELIVDPKKSYPGGKKASLDDNLIIHGDNLEALKALLPRYAGKVDVIYIDPPYNTGNEGWAYNDNVNSPLMKEWLGKVVDRDDLERHDKWLCMMWPRLQLLQELLCDEGLIFISIDINEQPRLCEILDEIFGEHNSVSHAVWHSKYTRANDAEFFSRNHEYILCYAKRKENANIFGEVKDEKQFSAYRNPDNDRRGKWKATPLSAKSGTNNASFIFPNGIKWTPDKGTYRRYGDNELLRLYNDKRIWFGRDGKAVPQRKTFVHEIEARMPPTTHLSYKDVGSTHDAKTELKELGLAGEFSDIKPSSLIEYLIEISTGESSRALILDSFAGSGTTAHAVLLANKKDGGSRKFILVEMEEYAESLTAERVRRVIKGVPNARDEELKKGLGGSFTYCELGEPIDLEKFFEGNGAPSYEQVARYVIYTATGSSVAKVPGEPRRDWFVGEAGGYRIHLIYKPDIAFMRSNDAALTMTLANRISKSAGAKPVLVYAAQKFVSQGELSKLGITFCQLPYSVYRILGDAPDAA